MSFFDAIDIAASGLSAERVRMDVTAENLANAQTTRGANGQPYQRQEVILQQTGGFGATLAGAVGSSPAPGGVQVTGIVSDPHRTSSSTTRAALTRTRRDTCACRM
jgi:flagellar basal-body rod protein FlgC